MQQQQFFGTRDKLITGIFLLLIGSLLMLNKLGDDIVPNWLVSWPMLAIGIGLLIAVVSKRKTILWVIPIFWGCYALAQEQMPELNLKQYSPAVSIIFVGILFLCMRFIPAMYINKSEQKGEVLNITTVFSHNQNSFSVSNTHGSRLLCIMGNMEIKLDGDFIQDGAVINTSINMGAVKLTVPPNWIIRNNMTSLLGAVTDNRHSLNTYTGTTKTVTLAGNVTMGALEIYS